MNSAARSDRIRTHRDQDGVTVFLIGMTINSWWRVKTWFPTFLAMPPMIAELSRNRSQVEHGEAVEDLGFLGATFLLGGRGPYIVQYWRSPEHLYRYASDTARGHRPRWAAFNARARKHPGVVGIWHETYAVPAVGVESFYLDTPTMGLATALGTAPASPKDRRHARAAAAAARDSAVDHDLVADADLVEQPGQVRQVAHVDAAV